MLWSGAHFREQRQAESSSLTMFALQESVCWSETYFREQHAFCWASVQHERRQAWCCGLEPIFESSGRRKVRLLPCLRFKKAFVGLKPIFESMTGRIVLSHVHVFTLRRTRSTEKLISTGLASGGIITLE